jgi:serine/threonine protein kinase
MLEHYQQADYSHFCPACLSEKGLQPRCPFCHYDEGKAVENPLYLQPRTLLKQQYLIGNVIGQGGFGITYVGLDINLRRKVAIKEYLPTSIATRAPHTTKESSRYTVIPWQHTQDHAFTGGLRSFLAEARKLAEFNHPHIVHVINYFEEHQTGYIVMDYVEGEDFSSLLKNKGGRLSETEALAWFFPILQALKEVHAKNLFHRDISAQNVRLTTANVPVLIDFGAAKYVTAEISRSLVDIYKLGYSPIEQMLGRKEIGAWTDIYASGALLYLMLTGKLPPISVDRLEKDELTPPIEVEGVQISPRLNQTILQALAVRIEDRFKTVAEFEQALRPEVVPPVGLPAPTTSSVATPKKKPAYRKYALALVMLSVVAALTLWLLPRFAPRQTTPVVALSGLLPQYTQGDTLAYTFMENQQPQTVKILSEAIENEQNQEVWRNPQSTVNKSQQVSIANWPIGKYTLKVVIKLKDELHELSHPFVLLEKDLLKPEVEIANLKANYLQGETVMVSIKARDNKSLKTLTFNLPAHKIQKIWDITDNLPKVEESYRLATDVLPPGPVHYVVTAKDTSGNVVEKGGEFVVTEKDKTAPVIALKGLQKKYTVGDEIQLSLAASDNKQLQSLVFTISDGLFHQEWLVKDKQFQTSLTLPTTKWHPKVYRYSLGATDISGNPVVEEGNFELSAKSGPTLSECEAHFKAKRWTSGDSGNALNCYQAVLKVEPNNVQAKQGLDKIEQGYQKMAEKSLRKKAFGELKTSLVELEKINPKSERLVELYWKWYFESNRQRESLEIFDNMTRIQVEHQHRIRNQFMFAKNSYEFKNKTRQQDFPFWLEKIGQHLSNNHLCLHILAYATKTEKEANLAQSRGEKIQQLLRKGFTEVLQKSLIISGTNEEAKVELKIVDCQNLGQ